MSSKRLIKTSNTKEETLLDETEQDSIINELKSQANNQSKQTRTAFLIIFFLLASCSIFCCLYMLELPWELQHQNIFRGIVPQWLFELFYLMTTFNFVFAGFIVKGDLGNQSKLKLGFRSFMTANSILTLLMWGFLFIQLGVTNLALYWLPFCNIFGTILAEYIDYDSSQLLNTAENLGQFKYHFKHV